MYHLQQGVVEIPNYMYRSLVRSHDQDMVVGYIEEVNVESR